MSDERAMTVLEQDKRMRGNGCCFIYGGRLLWEGSRSRDLLVGEAEKDTLTTWMRYAERTQTQMQWVLRWVFSSPFIPFPPAEVENLEKKNPQNPCSYDFEN